MGSGYWCSNIAPTWPGLALICAHSHLFFSALVPRSPGSFANSFRTVLQDTTRKYFSLNLLPRHLPLPLWIHPKLLGEDTSFVSQDHIFGGLLPSGAALGAATKAVLGPGPLFDSMGLRFLAALQPSYMDCHVRYPGFALHLRTAHLPALAYLVSSLRDRGVRPNPLLIGEAAVDVVRLTAQVAGSEVVFGEGLQQPGGQARFRNLLVDLIMRAGTRDERVIFALPLHQCDNTILSPLVSFMMAGEISDLLSPDNMVAVSTLTQPRVLAAGLQPSLANAWRYFKEAMRRNLRIVLYLPPWGSDTRNQVQRLLAYSPAMLSSLNVVLWPACDEDDLFFIAQEQVGQLVPAPPTAGDVQEYLGPLLTALHKSVLGCAHHAVAAGKDADVLRHVSATDFDLFVRQSVALIIAQWRKGHEKIVRLQRGVELTQKAESRVQHLRATRGNLEAVLQEKAAITTRLLAQLGRDMAAMQKTKETLASQQTALEEQRKASQQQELQYQSMLQRLSAHAARLQRLIASITDADIKELQLLTRPPASVEAVFQALLLLVHEGTKNNEAAEFVWRTGGKRLCSDVKRFRATLASCETRTVSENRLKEVEQVLDEDALQDWMRIPLSDVDESHAAVFQTLMVTDVEDDVIELAGGSDGTAGGGAAGGAAGASAAAMSSSGSGASIAASGGAGGSGPRSRRLPQHLQDAPPDRTPTVVPRLVLWVRAAVELHRFMNDEARPLESAYKKFQDQVIR